jgi:ribosome maturation factor RimP
MGYEFVDLEWGGSDARPILRLRVDRADSSPGNGVTLEDCVRVSRGVEPWLDAFRGLPERYTLEVSSPGVERPLIKRRDFVRFAGSEVQVHLRAAIEAVPSGARFDAHLAGVEDADPGVADVGGSEARYAIRLRLKDGSEVRVDRGQVLRARTRYRWEEEE